MKNYYDVLLIPPFSNAQTASRAYRVLSKRYHPDKNPDDPKAEPMMKAINEAKGVLCNPARKEKYDRDLYSALHASQEEVMVEEELSDAQDHNDVVRATEELSDKASNVIAGLSCISFGLVGVVCGLFFLLTGERSKMIYSFIAAGLGLVVHLVMLGLIYGIQELGKAYGLKL